MPPPPSTSHRPRPTLDAYSACLPARVRLGVGRHLNTVSASGGPCPTQAELVRRERSTGHMMVPRISSPFSSPGSGSRLLIVRSPPIHERRSINHTGGQNDAPQIRRATEKIKPTPNDQTPDTMATAPSNIRYKNPIDRTLKTPDRPFAVSSFLFPLASCPRILDLTWRWPPMAVETGTITVKPACRQAGAAWPRPARLGAQGRRHHACPPLAETPSPREVLTDDD